MGLEKIGMGLAERTASWVKAAGKTSILQTKPINPTQLQGLRFANNLTCDSVQLSNTSYLSESFVKSLTQIKGEDSLETAILIKNEILKKMGYKQPDLLKLYSDSSAFAIAEKMGACGGFSPVLARLDLSKSVINLPIEQQISLLYHELDHMDKYVKLYKTVGEKQFYNLLDDMKNNSPFYEVMVKRGINTDMVVNNDFYRRMSDGINIQDFDVNKWSKAVREYSALTPRYCDKYKYYNNPLENSAYNLQSKINKILGLPIETPRDAFPKNYASMIDLLKRQGITDTEKQERIMQEVLGICQIKSAQSVSKSLLLLQFLALCIFLHF